MLDSQHLPKDDHKQENIARNIEHPDESKCNGSTSEISDNNTNKKTFASKILLTCWLCAAYAAFGLNDGIIGPSLLDLISIVNVSLAESSFFTISDGIGFFIFTILAGIAVNHINRDLQIFIALFIQGLLTTAVPHCKYISLMCAVNLFRGACSAITELNLTVECVHLWNEDSELYMHIMHLSCGLAWMLSPIIVNPFLKPNQGISPVSSITFPENTHIANRSDVITIMPHSYEINFLNTSPGVPLENQTTKIQYAFLIVGIFTVVSAVPFIFNCIQNNCTSTKLHQCSENENLLTEGKIIPLGLLMSFYFFYNCLQYGIIIYFPTFLIKYLSWSTERASIATSVFWVCFVIGRFLGVFLVKIFGTNNIFLFDLIVLNISYIVLQWCKSSLILVWVFFSISTFAISRLLPSSYNWAKNNSFNIEGKFTGATLFFSILGFLIGPSFIAYMMDKYSPYWFLIISLVCANFCLVSILLMNFKCCHKNKESNAVNSAPTL